VAGFLSFNEEPEQYLFAYVLRPGNVTASIRAIGILAILASVALGLSPRTAPSAARWRLRRRRDLRLP
jgi:hypothetical protein